MDPLPGPADPEIRVRLRGMLLRRPCNSVGGGVGDRRLVRQPVLGRHRGGEDVGSTAAAGYVYFSSDGAVHNSMDSTV